MMSVGAITLLVAEGNSDVGYSECTLQKRSRRPSL
jgi:hypothetical protein